MHTKLTIRKLSLLIALGFCAGVSASYAGEERSNQTLESAPDVYRVEIKNLGALKVISTGEKDNDTGELHEVGVTLKAGTQFDSYHETSYHLINQKEDRGNKGFLNVRAGDEIRFRNNGAPHLWIHVNKQDLEFQSVVQFVVNTNELDCPGKRVCDTNNKGYYTLSFKVPKFMTPPPNRCLPENTYPLTGAKDGQDMISGLDSHSREETKSNGGVQVFASGKVPGAILHPTSGSVCIASTKFAPGQKAWPAQATISVGLRNMAVNKCLTNSKIGSGRNLSPAVINSCRSGIGTVARAQQWSLDRKSKSTWAIRQAGTDLCLNLKKSQDDRPGGPVKLASCSGHPDQLWSKTRHKSGAFKLQNIATSKCLTLAELNDNREGGPVKVYPCSNTPEQLWAVN